MTDKCTPDSHGSGESLKNIRAFCSEHSPKPDPQYFDKPFDWFVGKFCKLAFIVYEDIVEEGGPDKELMWVKVNEVTTDDDGLTCLKGTLDNHPIYFDASFGEILLFDRDEIIAVME